MKRVALGGQGASFARNGSGQRLKLTLFAGVSSLTLASLALAGPEGGTVVQGAATISNPVATTTQIDQSTDKAIINWNSFNVGQNESAVFNQPNAASVTLNRIFDQDPTIIAGLVSANGRLVLINANGMVFENGATVNTAGLIATTADISNDDFMAGSYHFAQAGAANASIVNKGQITAEEGGVVAFVAPSVHNSGVITAKLGTVALGAGNTFTLDLYGDNLISFPVSAEIAQQLTGPDGQPLGALVDVSGKIDAGSVQLTARAARGIIDSVINVDGEIIASGVKQSSAGNVAFVGSSGNGMTQNTRASDGVGGTFPVGYGGAIVIDGGENRVDIGGTLTASGAEGGSISLTGSRVDVAGSLSATGSAGQGGSVAIGAKEINLSDASIDASGATGGGPIAIGFSGSGASRSISADTVFVSQGSTLKADAIDSGDGGRIEFWSNLATDFRGSISAKGGAASGDGGFLEVSSKGEVGFLGTADASAPTGEAGILSLDPKNIIISIVGGALPSNPLTFSTSSTLSLTINPNSITSVLNTGTAVTLQASNDITVSSNITANNPGGNGGNLTMQAGRSVLINADITTDNGDLTIIANELLSAGVIDAQRDPGSAVITMGVGADIDAGTGSVRLAILDGAGKTNLTSADMTLRNVTAASILAENLGATAGSDVIMASGALIASGGGTPLVVASQSGTFTNNAGATALQAPNGRWLVYTNTPAATNEGGLAGTPFYNTVYNPADPTGVSATGNKFAYSLAANVTVTPTSTSRAYGAPNPAFTYTITGLQAGDTLAAAVQGAPDITTTATATSSVAGGPYPITATLGTLASAYNYGFTFAPGQLSITAAQLIYLADPKTREYGDPNGVLTGSVQGLLNGDVLTDVTTGELVFASPAFQDSPIGIYEIVGGGLTVTSANYSVTIAQDPSNATALTITPAQLTYLADIVSQTYGDIDLGDIDGELLGLKNGDDLEEVGIGIPEFSSSVTLTSGVGTYAVNGSGFLVTNPNYVTTVLQAPTNATAFTINPAQLFYVAFDETREYGEDNPPLSGSVEGLVNGDTLELVASGTAVFTTAATALTDVGSYAILGSGLTVTSANYIATIVQDNDNASALEIVPAILTYIANPATRIYGDPDPAFSGTIIGFKNGETVDQVTTGTMVFTTSATALSNVGDYDILGGGLIVTSGNYVVDIEQADDNFGALSITPAQLFYQADPVTRSYGAINPTFTGTLLGLKNGETLEAVTDGNLFWEADADETSSVGVYFIEGTGLAVVSANYEGNIEQAATNAAALTITPAQLIYLADSKFRFFGFPEPEFTGQVLGLANGDDLEDATGGTLIWTTTATESSIGGLYPILGGGLTVTNVNYNPVIVQDPSNATALTLQDIPAQNTQALGESANDSGASTVDQEQNDMTSRPNDLGIAGVDTVTDDMSDGKNDQLSDQLCVLSVPEAAVAPGCVQRQQMQGR